MGPDDIYDPSFVRKVFDRCSDRYRVWSQVASFGLVWRWRRQCIDRLPVCPSDDATAVDLMAGTGETWSYLLKRRPEIHRILALDISPRMVELAIARLHRGRLHDIHVVEANILEEPSPNAIADIVICSFGLKTLNPHQQRLVAAYVAKILKPGGVYSFIEASDPADWMFADLYRFYLQSLLPLIERFFLHGAQDFAMIGRYTAAFGNCQTFADALRQEGLEVRLQSYFFGCATGVTGSKAMTDLLP